MSKLSKTARASTVKEMDKSAVILSDAERVRLIRIEIASNIYPSCENSRALLRVADAESLRLTAEVERLDIELAETKRQLALAQSK